MEVYLSIHIWPFIHPYIYLPHNKCLLGHLEGPGATLGGVRNQNCPRGVFRAVEAVRILRLPSLEFSRFILLVVAASSWSSRFPGDVLLPGHHVLGAKTHGWGFLVTGQHGARSTPGRNQPHGRGLSDGRQARPQRQQAAGSGASLHDLCALFMACHLQLQRQAAL